MLLYTTVLHYPEIWPIPQASALKLLWAGDDGELLDLHLVLF